MADEPRECACDGQTSLEVHTREDCYDRRDRYAAAMAAANGAGPEWAYEWRPEADAALAVADEEHRDLRDKWHGMCLRYEEQFAENARLRAELASSKAAHRAVWEKHQARGARIFELLGEMGGLREELDEVREGAELWSAAQREDAWARLTAEATIERVRASLDYCDRGSRIAVLEALGGEHE